MGSNAAFALQCAGMVSEIQILDANEDLAQGEALDLMHGASVLGISGFMQVTTSVRKTRIIS